MVILMNSTGNCRTGIIQPTIVEENSILSLAIRFVNDTVTNGIDSKNFDLLIDFFELVLSFDSYDINEIVHLQTIVMILAEDDLPYRIKRYVDEVKARLIRLVAGKHWKHGVKLISIDRTYRDHGLSVANRKETIYEDGYIDRITVDSVHGDLNEISESPINDIGALLFEN